MSRLVRISKYKLIYDKTYAIVWIYYMYLLFILTTDLLTIIPILYLIYDYDYKERRNTITIYELFKDQTFFFLTG